MFYHRAFKLKLILFVFLRIVPLAFAESVHTPEESARGDQRESFPNSKDNRPKDSRGLVKAGFEGNPGFQYIVKAVKGKDGKGSKKSGSCQMTRVVPDVANACNEISEQKGNKKFEAVMKKLKEDSKKTCAFVTAAHCLYTSKDAKINGKSAREVESEVDSKNMGTDEVAGERTYKSDNDSQSAFKDINVSHPREGIATIQIAGVKGDIEANFVINPQYDKEGAGGKNRDIAVVSVNCERLSPEKTEETLEKLLPIKNLTDKKPRPMDRGRIGKVMGAGGMTEVDVIAAEASLVDGEPPMESSAQTEEKGPKEKKAEQGDSGGPLLNQKECVQGVLSSRDNKPTPDKGKANYAVGKSNSWAVCELNRLYGLEIPKQCIGL